MRLERHNFDADYMQVLCPDRQRYEKASREAAEAAAATQDLLRRQQEGEEIPPAVISLA